MRFNLWNILVLQLLLVVCLSQKIKTIDVHGVKVTVEKPTDPKFWEYWYDYDYDYDNMCANGCWDGWPGDGWCDWECYNAECNYDNGDCGEGKETRQTESCASDEWECDSGMCIPLVNDCDGIVHCDDGSDEGGCDDSDSEYDSDYDYESPEEIICYDCIDNTQCGDDCNCECGMCQDECYPAFGSPNGISLEGWPWECPSLCQNDFNHESDYDYDYESPEEIICNECMDEADNNECFGDCNCKCDVCEDECYPAYGSPNGVSLGDWPQQCPALCAGVVIEFDYDFDYDYIDDEESLAYVSEILIAGFAGLGLCLLAICSFKQCGCKGEDHPTFNCIGKGRIAVNALSMVFILVAGALNRNASQEIDYGFAKAEYHIGYLTYWIKIEAFGLSDISHGDICADFGEDSESCIFGAAATAFSIGACFMITLAIMFSFCKSKFWCMTMIVNLLAGGCTVIATAGCLGVYLDTSGEDGFTGDDGSYDIGLSVIMMIIASVFVIVNLFVHCCNGGFKKPTHEPGNVEMTGNATHV